jgi:hypothetical protein
MTGLPAIHLTGLEYLSDTNDCFWRAGQAWLAAQPQGGSEPN